MVQWMNGQWNGLPLKNPNAPCPPCLSPNPFFYRPGLYPYVTPPPLMILSEAPPPLLIFSEAPSCVLAPSHLYTPVPSPNPYPLVPPSRRTPNPRKEKWLNGYLSNGNDSMTSNDLLGHSPPVVLYCLAAGQGSPVYPCTQPQSLPSCFQKNYPRKEKWWGRFRPGRVLSFTVKRQGRPQSVPVWTTWAVRPRVGSCFHIPHPRDNPLP